MDRNGIAALLLSILLLFHVSTATSIGGGIVKFFREAVNRNDAATQNHVSPRASPVIVSNRAGPSSNSPEGSGNKSSKSGPKASDKTVSVAPPPQNAKEKQNSSKQWNETSVATPQNPAVLENKTDSTRPTAPPSHGNGDDDRKGGKDKVSSQPSIGRNCEGVPDPCSVQNSLVACIRSLNNGSKELVVQNEGEQTLLVDLRITTTGERTYYPLKQLKIEQNGVETMIMSGDAAKASEIILSAGNGECVLLMDVPASEGNFFVRMPSYSELVTPINGAYLLIGTVVILGCTWACCKFRSRRRHEGGIPYQELEMGLPNSVSATEVETADGWDQGWDDDWDDENAVKPPAVHHAGSISVNGLTSRSTNKDGWGNDWDD